MSLRFQANNDQVSYSGTMPDPVAGITITGWGKVSVDTNTNATFFRESAAGNTTITCATESDGTQGPSYFTAGGSVNFPSQMVVGDFYAFALVCLGTSATVYRRSGGVTTSASGTVAGSVSPNQMVFGGRSPTGTTESLNGCTCWCKVWPSVFTQTDIEAEWAAGPNAVITSGLFANWPMETIADLTDHSGNGRNLTAGTNPATDESNPSLFSVWPTMMTLLL